MGHPGYAGKEMKGVSKTSSVLYRKLANKTLSGGPRPSAEGKIRGGRCALRGF